MSGLPICRNKNIYWQEREAQLINLCNKYRSTNGSYDCIVPGSGGKDGGFTAHLLKYKYNMNPLTVTWAPHVYTEIGWKNFQRWIEVGGFDNVLVTPNGKAHRLMAKLAFENLCHPFQPFIIGQKIVGPRAAIQNNIPLVFYGENQAEYGNNIKDNEKPLMNNEFFTDELTPDNLVIGGVTGRDLINKYGLSESDLSLYMPLDKSLVKSKKIEMHYLGYYIKWDPQENYYYCVENTGFSANEERTEGSYSKYSGIDDKMDTLHYFTSYIKFGLGRATYDAAQEIRNGKITREEGVALVHKYDAEIPSKYFTEMMEYLNLSEDEFWNVIDSFRPKHLWTKKDNSWVLKNPVK